MPPAGSPRPDAATYEAIADRLEAALDRAWKASPNPGRINAVHRLNRTEYKNAIRDLLARKGVRARVLDKINRAGERVIGVIIEQDQTPDPDPPRRESGSS